MVEFYFKKGPQIFQKVPVWTSLRNLLFAKYSEKTIERVFQEKSCFGDKLLGESKKRLIIPSYNIDTNDVYVFKTAHHERFKRDYKVPTWKIARATSTAPTFFPICKNIDSIRLVDGGVWANNPAMVGLFEATAILDIPLPEVRIFSVGTTEELKQSPRILGKYGGWPFWANTAVELIMQAQSVGISAQLKLLLKENFVRVNPKVPAGLFGLDRMNMDELFAFASTYSRMESPNFNAKFKNHQAEAFVPIHKLER